MRPIQADACRPRRSIRCLRQVRRPARGRRPDRQVWLVESAIKWDGLVLFSRIKGVVFGLNSRPAASVAWLITWIALPLSNLDSGGNQEPRITRRAGIFSFFAAVSIPLSSGDNFRSLLCATASYSASGPRSWVVKLATYSCARSKSLALGITHGEADDRLKFCNLPPP